MAERMQLATEQDVTNYADETNTKLTTLQSDVTEVKDNTKEVQTLVTSIDEKIGTNNSTETTGTLFDWIRKVTSYAYDGGKAAVQAADNTASSTTANSSGTLSQKLSYIISSLIGTTNSGGGLALVR